MRRVPVPTSAELNLWVLKACFHPKDRPDCLDDETRVLRVLDEPQDPSEVADEASIGG